MMATHLMGGAETLRRRQFFLLLHKEPAISVLGHISDWLTHPTPPAADIFRKRRMEEQVTGAGARPPPSVLPSLVDMCPPWLE